MSNDKLQDNMGYIIAGVMIGLLIYGTLYVFLG